MKALLNRTKQTTCWIVNAMFRATWNKVMELGSSWLWMSVASAVWFGGSLRAEADSWYLNADAGLNFQKDFLLVGKTLQDGVTPGLRVKFNTGFRFDLDGGYCLGKLWAVELESGVAYNAASSVFTPPASATLNNPVTGTKLFQVPILANYIFKHPLGHRFEFRLGAGVGGVVDVVDAGSWRPFGKSFSLGSSTDFAFGYQGLGGVQYLIADRWRLGVNYRILCTTGLDMLAGGTALRTDSTRAQSVLASVSYEF
jgi:opacity protein-like surface antigen